MSIFDNAPIISAYTREQAIADGVLVDLMQPDTVQAVREAGFKFPIAMTSAAFEAAVWPIENETADEWLASQGQDFQGRLWDVLNLLRVAIRQHPGDTDILRFQVSVIDFESKRRRTVNLKSVCGPNDDGSPCVTIMMNDED